MNSLRKRWNNIPLAVKVSTAYATCSIFQKGLALITLPLFTRLLTTEEYGQYTVYASWEVIITLFLTLNLIYGSFKTAMIKFEDRRSEYVSAVQGICLFLTILFLLLYLPFRHTWNKLLELPTSLMIIMCSEILFATSTSLWMGRNRFEFRYKLVVIITVVMSVISPILAYILVCRMEDKGFARIAGYAIVKIIVGMVFFAINLKNGKHLFHKEFWSYALRFNIPLLIYYLSEVIFNQSDRIMIRHLLGAGDAAKYGVAYNLAMILTIVINAINGSYVPWLYGKIKENKGKENRAIAVFIALLMGALILCVIWFAPEIIVIIAGNKYADATYVVAPVAMSLFLLVYCQFYINIEFFYEEKRMLIAGSVGAAVINIVLNYFLIPVFGIVAAGYTTLFSYVIFALSNLFTMKMLLKKRGLKDEFYDHRALTLTLIGFMTVGFLGIFLYRWLLPRAVVTLSVLLILVLNLKKILARLNEFQLFRPKSPTETGEEGGSLGDSRVIGQTASVESIKDTAVYRMLRAGKGFLRQLAALSVILRYRMKKKHAENGRTSVVFLVQFIPAWDKARLLYETMKASEDFDVHIVCVPSELTGLEKNDTFEYFVSSGVDAIDASEGKNDSGWFDLKQLSPDYVITFRPYDHFMPASYSAKALAGMSTLCNIVYGPPMTTALQRVVYEKRFFNYVGCFFAESDEAGAYFEREHRIGVRLGLQRTMSCGMPILEEISRAERKEHVSAWEDSRASMKILWTPRWTTDPTIGGSHFFDYKDLWFKLIEQHEGIEVIMRPHPLMFVHFIEDGEMTEEEYAAYRTECDRRNLIIDSSETYIGTFYDTSILVTDISSIIQEYFVLNKPVIYCPPDEQVSATETMKRIIEGCYVARNSEELEAHIVRIMNGQDDLSETRKRIMGELFGDTLHSSCRMICNELRNHVN